MRKTYPRYERGSTATMRTKLKGKEKKIYQDFMSFLATTAGKRKMVDYEMFFLQFCDIMQKPVYKLVPQDFVDFWALVNQDETREINTKNNIKRTAKRFLKWQYAEDLKMLRIADQLRLKSQIVNKKKINKQALVTEAELAKMLKVTTSIMLKAQIKTLYNCALRPEELRNAKWSAVDWDKKTIHVRSNKTGEVRELPLADAIDHLRRWNKEFVFDNVSENDYIFPSPQDRSRPYHPWTFRYNVEKLGKKAGIERTIYPYLLRHTRLNELREKKVNTKTRSLFAGHSVKMAEEVYNHMDHSDMIEEVTKVLGQVEELNKNEREEFNKRIATLEKQQATTLKLIAKLYSETTGKKAMVHDNMIAVVKEELTK